MKTKIAQLGVSEEKMDFMPPAASAQHVQISELIVQDKKYVSDHSGFTNAMKWEHILNVFKAPKEKTLFAELCYEDIYVEDDAAHAEAAAFLADLRAQYFSKLLDDKFTPENHLLYLVNRQWMVRFRERAALAGMAQAMKTRLLH